LDGDGAARCYTTFVHRALCGSNPANGSCCGATAGSDRCDDRTVGSDDRNLEYDLMQLAPALRDHHGFADELYCALCNTEWAHDDGTEWTGSWRYAAGIVAHLRGRGEDYMDFYCSGGGSEGTISSRVRDALATLGWHGSGHQ